MTRADAEVVARACRAARLNAINLRRDFAVWWDEREGRVVQGSLMCAPADTIEEFDADGHSDHECLLRCETRETEPEQGC